MLFFFAFFNDTNSYGDFHSLVALSITYVIQYKQEGIETNPVHIELVKGMLLSNIIKLNKDNRGHK